MLNLIFLLKNLCQYCKEAVCTTILCIKQSPVFWENKVKKKFLLLIVWPQLGFLVVLMEPEVFSCCFFWFYSRCQTILALSAYCSMTRWLNRVRTKGHFSTLSRIVPKNTHTLTHNLTAHSFMYIKKDYNGISRIFCDMLLKFWLLADLIGLSTGWFSVFHIAPRMKQKKSVHNRVQIPIFTLHVLLYI